jgi:hypothetical protein
MSSEFFTATAIAQALGCSKQNVHQRLAHIPADGEQLNSGNLAKAWRVESLAPEMLRDLASKAQLKRYLSVAALLTEPSKHYAPEIPFAEIAPTAREKALKLQRAQRPFIPLRNNEDAKSAEFAQRGVDEFRRVFGYPINAKHWRALFDRTIERDNGNEEWARPELYVDENPPRISASRPIAFARERGLTVLEDALAIVVKHGELNVERKTYLWTKACDELQLQIESGAHEKKTKRGILKTLLASGLLGADKETIRRNLNRQWNTYHASGGKLSDGRGTRDQRKKLPKSDREKLIARSLDCGGRIRQAFRELRDNGELSEQTLARTITNPRRKSHIPARISREITPEVKRLMPLHRGVREYELRGPYVPQDHASISAGEVMQLDDVTLPVYFWEHDPESPGGVFFGRGQWILAIDVRSRMVLGHALHSASVYNMRIVRGLLLRVHDVWGLPESLLLERGMWKTAKIIKGDELDISHTEQGLREFGVAFHHRTKPRGKIIERVIGLLQNQMERLPGYAGRDERHDRFERTQELVLAVTSGREHPGQHFLGKTDWLKRLNEIVLRYNRERQEGKLQASPLEAWNANLLPQGTVHLGKKARFLLAHHRTPVKVQPYGVRLRASLGGGLYYNRTTGRFAGQRMIAWVNPDELDAIALTSLDRRDGPYIVERAQDVPTIGASNEQLGSALAQIDEHNEYARTQYRVIQDQLARRDFRPLFVDASTRKLGDDFETRTADAKQERQKRVRVVKTAQRLVRERGINVRVDTKNAERAKAAAELHREAYSDSSATGASE